LLRNKIMLVLVILVAAGLVVSVGCAKKRVVPTSELPSAPPKPAETVETPKVQEETAQPEEVVEETAQERVAAGIRDVFFAFDDYTLSEEARTLLAIDAKLLAANKSVKLTIEGHCDERGTVEYNLALGEKRALSAKNYLVNYGIDASRISIISYGKERPFDTGHDEDAWAKNRRAHFVIGK